MTVVNFHISLDKACKGVSCISHIHKLTRQKSLEHHPGIVIKLLWLIFGDVASTCSLVKVKSCQASNRSITLYPIIVSNNGHFF